MNLLRSFSLGLLLLYVTASPLMSEELTQVEQQRNSLISQMLSKQLPSLHYSDKELDNALSEAAFSLYLKQLDYQKRFLLQSDVDELRAHFDRIDDEMRAGSTALPELGYKILQKRIGQVQKDNDAILAAGIDRKSAGKYQGDPKKQHFAVDRAELRIRWQQILKSQVMSNYLDLCEDQQKAGKGAQATTEKPRSDAELWSDAEAKVTKRNRVFLHRLSQESLQDHVDRYFNSVTRAFGPHTNYIAPASKEQFDINMRGSLEGIGAMLREDDGVIKVVRVIPGSASARQGALQAEDTILAVAQADGEAVDVSDMRLRDAVRLIRGTKGTEVRLTVRHDDGMKEVIPIIRDVVQMEDTFVKSFVVAGDNGQRIGYINIPSFYRDFEKSRKGEKGRNSTDDTRRELVKLKQQGIDGVVLDLRNNGGGALVDAVDIAGLFVSSGPMVQIRTSMGDKRTLYDQDNGIVYDGPLVVLVNKFSASASEIVAAALQDYHRAIIIGGAHTHGKGSVQTVLDLNEYVPWLSMSDFTDLGALKIMIQKFYRINGGSTQYKGVEPDIVLPSIYEHLKSGERYLDYSLPWDSIDAVEYSTFEPAPNVSMIRERSNARVAASSKFQAIRDEVAKAEKRSQDTYIYIDLERMKRERKIAKEARERLGAEVKLFEEEKGVDSKEQSQEEKNKLFEREVGSDPWVLEAGRVIEDIRKQLS